MRIAMLTPAPDYGHDWSWAFDIQAEALRAECPAATLGSGRPTELM